MTDVSTRRTDETEATAKALEDVAVDCDVLDFPTLRHDFSDTKIYWRRQINGDGGKQVLGG